MQLDLKFNGIYQEAAEKILDGASKQKKCFVDLTNRFDEKFNDFYFKGMRKIGNKKKKKKKKKKNK